MQPAALGRPLPPILPWPCLQRGCTVIDPFMGTSSTIAARITAAYEAAQAESLRHV